MPSSGPIPAAHKRWYGHANLFDPQAGRAVLLALGVVAACSAAAAQERLRIDLSGEWQYQKVPELTFPPPEDGWQSITIPGALNGWNYERAWFRRTVDLPESIRGQRVKLHFGGVKYNSTVYVNGQRAGGHFGGYDPFDVDATEHIRPGAENEIVVGVHDWTGIFSEQVDLEGQRRPGGRLRSIPRDVILAPIGGRHELYGIWDDVHLSSAPPVHVSDVFAQPSVRNARLAAQIAVANEGDRPQILAVAAQVIDGNRRVLTLPSQTVALPAGATKTITLSETWRNPKLWTPDAPHLYMLRTSLLANGRPIDSTDTRFGFRELWAEGPDFYLNGAKVVLRATSWWPPAPQTREQVENTIRAIKAGNSICFRTHTQPWRRIWYEVADELGLMMIPEGAVWNDDYAYRIDDQAFWDNYATHLRRMASELQNHPSIVMWSLENEMYGGRLNDASPAKAQLVNLGRLMRQYDPTRLITYESDLDPGGIADVIGLHYPHEYPQFNLYPDTCYWLDEEIPMTHGFTDGTRRWKWQRDKPLYIGEFLWVPSSDPSWHTVFFGEDAYNDYRDYRNRGKAMSWRMQIEAYRWQGVGGISPWTEGEGGALDDTNHLYVAQREAFEPIAAYVTEDDTRFYEGSNVERTLHIYNDVLEASDLQLQWTLTRHDELLDKREARIELGPGERAGLTFFFRVPQARERTPCVLSVSLRRRGRKVFQARKSYSAFPRPRLAAPAGATVGIYDPLGRTRQQLTALGLTRMREIDALDGLPADLDVLIIGAGTLEPQREAGLPVVGGDDTGAAALAAFVQRGGRLCVLRQEEYPGPLLGAVLSPYSSTMAFLQMPSHPVLAGLEPDDFKWWRGDHMVSEREVVRPVRGACRPIIVSGSSSGLNFCPLLELPRGSGTAVLCQLKLIDKLAAEPIAAQIIQNVINYLADYRPGTGAVAVASDSEALKRRLSTIGLLSDDVTGNLPATPLTGYRVLIASGSSADEVAQAASQVGEFVDRGGYLLLHRLTPDQLTALKSLIGADISLQRTAAPLSLGARDPVTASLTKEDLYWLGQHVGVGHTTTPRSAEMIDFMFGKSIEGKQATTYEAEDMRAEGKIVHPIDGGIGMFTVGSASTEADFGPGGTYIFGLSIGGTSALRVWPDAELRIGRRLIGRVTAPQADYSVVTLFGEVSPGKHTVSVSFPNDGSGPDEDRNLYFDKLLIAKDEPSRDGAIFLTTPPALAKIPRGKGAIIIDQIKWDTERRNDAKAARYICGLLTELGARFRTAAAVYIEAEAMEPKPDMSHFRRTPASARLGTNGYIETAFRCAASGRYVFALVAGGTPAEGEYPIVEVHIDGASVGAVTLESEAMSSYPLEVELTEGEHQLRLVFTNDKHAPPEDRNLFIDRVEVSQLVPQPR
ncbi:MAG: carbohydrate-binding domain-containing protein [Armatimonadota bacterium]